MCVLCKIVAGEIPSMKVEEEEHGLIFMEMAGGVAGHMLAVPKKHVKNILDCDLDTLNHLMTAVKKVANHCVTNGGYEGVNLLNASDESAGQSVSHFHIHLIPRKNGDEVNAWPKFEGASQEIEEVWKKIKLLD